MPRHAAPRLDLETRLRNTNDAQGRVALAGQSRLASRRGGRGVGGGQTTLLLGGDTESSSSGQILVLSATDVSIASGGDYVAFDTQVHRHGFVAAIGGDGVSITWPIAYAGGTIQVEWEWDTYTGGGTIEIEVDGAVPEWGTVVSGSAGRTFVKARAVDIAEGAEVKIKVTQDSGSAQTATVYAEFVCPDPRGPAKKFVETVWLDTRSPATATSTATLLAGAAYRFSVTGNRDGDDDYTGVDTNVDDVLYPSDGQPASSDATHDADVKYALVSPTDPDTVPTHDSSFEIDTGSGYSHIEPVGGPYSAPQPGHVYDFEVTGEGSVVSFRINGADQTDNNGQYRIDIHRVNA